MTTSLVLLVAQHAAAQATGSTDEPHLNVTRAAGAESCPDAHRLAEHVRRVRGRQATRVSGDYRVSFSRQGGLFRASIRIEGASGARVLRDRGATCGSLAQATALTLALLLDSDASELPPETAEPSTAAPSWRDEPAPEPLAPLPAARRVSLTLAAGGLGLFGVMSSLSPAVAGELGIGVGRFRTSIGALWVPTQTLELGMGTVEESLVGGVARMCLSPWQGASLRFDLCSGVYAGLLQVHASGYTRNDAARKPWLSVPAELALSTVSPLGAELGLSALLPLRRNDFAIDNVGVAYESWPVGLLLSLRAVGAWLL